MSRWSFAVIEGHGYIYDEARPAGHKIVASVDRDEVGARFDSIRQLLSRLAELEKAADLNSSDCCSGFVTQEGRDIHQAIEHKPQNPDFSDHPAPASLPTALRSRATDRGGGGETAP